MGSRRGNRRAAASRPTSGTRSAGAQAAFPADPAPRPTKPELAREAIALVAGWAAALAPARPVYVVGDTAYVNRTTIEGRPANVEVLGPLHPEAALFAPPPPRRPGHKGRPRTRGERRPAPAAQAQARRPGTWHRLPVTLYGRTVTPLVFRGTALWDSVLRAAPLRYVVVRDPSGRRTDAALGCTDLRVSVAFILETYAKRGPLEVTFFLVKGLLGFEAPQNQPVRAVRRTAPFAGLVFALIILWYATALAAGRVATGLVRPWYRRKAAPSFADVLATLRQQGLAAAAVTPGLAATRFLPPRCPHQRPGKSRHLRHLTRTALR